MSHGPRSHNERVTGLEVSVGNLDDRLTVIESKLDSQFESTRTALLALNDRFSETRRTSWGVLAGWAAVVVSLVGIVGASYLRDLDRVLASSEKHAAAFLDHVRDGHPYSVQDKITALRSEIDKTHALTDRELDSRFAGMGAEIDRLDARIDEVVSSRMTAAEKRIEALEAFHLATALSRFTQEDGHRLRSYVDQWVKLAALSVRSPDRTPLR